MPKPKPAPHVSEGPMLRDADPTAPAGMTRSDIRVELAEKHAINMDTTREVTLPALVSMLVQSRLSHDAEVRAGKPTLAQRLAATQAAHQETYEDGAYEIEEIADSTWDREVSDDLIEAEVDDSLCKHGEDPVLCEACEDEMLGGDLEDDEDDNPADDLHDTADQEPEPMVAAESEAAWLADEEPEVDELIAWMDEEPEPTFTDEIVDTEPLGLPARIVKHKVDEEPEVVNLEDIYEPDAEQVFTEVDDLDPESWMAEVQTEQDNVTAALPPALFIGMPGVLDYSFAGHAGTGPSGADRWMNCTASLGLSRKFLERLSQNQQAEFADANTAARQGTTAHAAAEVEARVILGELDANEAEHELFELAINPPAGEDYTPEMAAFITEYTDLIGGYVADGHEVLIEARVLAAVPLTAPLTLETREFMGLEEGDDDYYIVTGSVDCGVMPTEEEKVLTAVDLKYGEGKDVGVERNPQIRLYMLGLLALFIENGGNLDDLERLDYIIAQPRLGGIKSWTESVNDLLTWRDDVLSPALTAALGLSPSVFAPGDETCQWCPARGGCSALADARVQQATELFTALDDAEFGDGPALVATDLDNERLASLLKQITGLTDLQADLKAEAQRRMYRGDVVPGMVLVNYTPPRSWRDDAKEFFSDEDNHDLPVWKDPELRTPTQFIKAMSTEMKGKNAKEREDAVQKKFARLIEVPEKRPVVAFEGDKRTPWQGKAPDQMFTVLDED